MKESILIIEDESSIADNLIYALETENFVVNWFTTGGEGKEFLNKEKCDLIILDVGLPDCNGFDLCKEIRQFSTIPILFLTARNDEIDRIVGLEIGGDDYITKPFSPREVTARVKAVFRRMATMNQTAQTSSEENEGQVFRIDDEQKSIHYFSQKLELSKYEYRLLELFIKNPKRVYTREQLMNIVWDEPDFSLERTVDTHIKTLRGKMKTINPDLNPIETRRGFGYAFKDIS